MLKMYGVISSVFILFLFGFTLITASPVFAEDSTAFIACQQMKGQMAKKNCFRNLARQLAGDSLEFNACQQIKRGRTKEQKNCYRDLRRAEEITYKNEINLCLASLKEIDERTFRNCNSAEESVDTMRREGTPPYHSYKKTGVCV